MALTVAEVAEKINGTCEGNGKLKLTGIAGLRDAEPGDLTFLANSRYAGDAESTRASAVIVPLDWDRSCSAALIRVKKPDEAFAVISALFAPEPVVIEPGIHPTALVADNVTLGRDVHIGPYTVLEPGVTVGDRTVIYPGCYIGHQTVIGADVKLYPAVTVRERVVIGDRVIVHNASVIGSDGFGYTVDDQGVRHKIPQVGNVVISDDVEIGAGVTIDRARFGKTLIGKGVKIDNLVQIAHNVIIEEHAVVVAQAGIAGSSRVEKHAILGGQVGVAGHLVIGERAMVGAQAGVTKNVQAGTYVSGYPAAPHEKAARLHAHVARLPELKKKVQDLEKRVQELEQKSSGASS